MQAFAIPQGAAAALLLAGCNKEQGRVEDAVRAQLSAGGTVTRVEMTRRGADEYTGYAIVRMADGHEARANCTMRRAGSGFRGMCGQVIDQQLIESTKAAIRQQFTAQGLTVTEVEMARQGDDLMAGHALVRDASGNEGRVDCTSPRDPTNGRFSLNCREAEAAAAPIPVEPPVEEPLPSEEEAPAGAP